MAEEFSDLESFYSSTLATSISASATTIVVAAAPDNITTGFLVIERNTSNEEIVKMTSRVTTSLTVLRGLAISGSDETAGANGVSHPAGAAIEVCNAHYYIKQIQIKNSWEFRGSVDTAGSLSFSNEEAGDLAFVRDTGSLYYYNGASWVTITGGTTPADASTSIKGIMKLSTAPASATNPIAVGDNDARVPTTDENNALAGTSGSPSSSNKYITEEDVSDAAASGEVVRASGTDLPALGGASLTGIIPNSGATQITLTAGETIDASSTPQAVYLKASDGKVWLADSDADESGFKFIGFVGGGQNVSAAASVIVNTQGTLAGFTALTAGDKLFLSSTAGSVSATPNATRPVQAAFAISTTEILIYQEGMKIVTGSTSAAVGTDAETDTITVGFRARIIIGKTAGASVDNTIAGLSSFFIATEVLNICLVTLDAGTAHDKAGGFTGKIGIMAINAGTVGDIQINNWTATGFDVVFNRFNPGTGVGGSMSFIAIG